MLKTTLYVLWSVLSVGSFCVLLHYALMTCVWPDAYLRLKLAVRDSFWAKPYLVLLAGSGATIGYVGCKALLFWMPESWGETDEYGEFRPLQETIAAIVAFLGLGLLSHLDTSATNALIVRGFLHRAGSGQGRMQALEEALEEGMKREIDR